MSDKTGKLLTKNIAGVNRILPHKHKYAWDLFLKSCANNWMPTEISMQNDIKQWKNNEITEDENGSLSAVLDFLQEASLWSAITCCYLLFDLLRMLKIVRYFASSF